jgi:hypothetical protein
MGYAGLLPVARRSSPELTLASDVREAWCRASHARRSPNASERPSPGLLGRWCPALVLFLLWIIPVGEGQPRPLCMPVAGPRKPPDRRFIAPGRFSLPFRG